WCDVATDPSHRSYYWPQRPSLRDDHGQGDEQCNERQRNKSDLEMDDRMLASVHPRQVLVKPRARPIDASWKKASSLFGGSLCASEQADLARKDPCCGGQARRCSCEIHPGREACEAMGPATLLWGRV